MLFAVIQEPKTKFRIGLSSGVKVVEAKSAAEAKRLAAFSAATGPYAKDFKAPYAIEIGLGVEFRV